MPNEIDYDAASQRLNIGIGHVDNVRSSDVNDNYGNPSA